MKEELEAYNTTPVATQERVTAKAVKKGRKAIEKRNQTLQRLAIEYIPIDGVKPNDYNPNRQTDHDFELLRRSMQEDGFTQPIVCMRDGTIVDGEHRWRAASSIGYTEIPVVYVDMSPEQMRISTLRHNRARGSEDIDLSTQVLRDLQELGAIDWALDSLMMSEDEVNRLLDDVAAPEALAAEQFSEAWEPDKVQIADHSVEGQEQGNLIRAATPAAMSDIRERERKLKEAKSEEERIQIRKDTNIFRVSLVFHGDEADTVKAALGRKPAQALIEICRRELEQALP